MMLSRVSGMMLRRAFSTTSIQTQNTQKAETLHTAISIEVPLDKKAIINDAELRALEGYAEKEKTHMTSFINNLRKEIRTTVDLNFAEPIENETVIFQTEIGVNNYRFAELLTVGALAKFCQLVMGFPSYAAMLCTLSLAGVGAMLSVSNHLRRSTPQITSVHLTTDRKLHVYYLAPGIIGNERKDLFVEPTKFGFASFDCAVKNWLFKSNQTSWFKVDGQLFWLNEKELRVNSQLYHQLF